MSTTGVLDQILLEDILRWCPAQFLEFHKCMLKPDTNCDLQQMALAKCIKSEVPLMQRIQLVCAGKLQAYDACLRMHNSRVDSCKHELAQLRECAFGEVDPSKKK